MDGQNRGGNSHKEKTNLIDQKCGDNDDKLEDDILKSNNCSNQIVPIYYDSMVVQQIDINPSDMMYMSRHNHQLSENQGSSQQSDACIETNGTSTQFKFDFVFDKENKSSKHIEIETQINSSTGFTTANIRHHTIDEPNVLLNTYDSDSANTNYFKSNIENQVTKDVGEKSKPVNFKTTKVIHLKENRDRKNVVSLSSIQLKANQNNDSSLTSYTVDTGIKLSDLNLPAQAQSKDESTNSSDDENVEDKEDSQQPKNILCRRRSNKKRNDTCVGKEQLNEIISPFIVKDDTNFSEINFVPQSQEIFVIEKSESSRWSFFTYRLFLFVASVVFLFSLLVYFFLSRYFPSCCDMKKERLFFNEKTIDDQPLAY